LFFACINPQLVIQPSFDLHSTVKDSSVICVQIFDQKKFKKKDQGFLGVVNVKVSSVIDLDLGGEGGYLSPFTSPI
jgi:hypothetical protein